jgi:hypothetical protein
MQDRNVRAANHNGIITPIHVRFAGSASELNAKSSGPTDFTRKRAVLLNIAAKPNFTHYR